MNPDPFPASEGWQRVTWTRKAGLPDHTEQSVKALYAPNTVFGAIDIQGRKAHVVFLSPRLKKP